MTKHDGHESINRMVRFSKSHRAAKGQRWTKIFALLTMSALFLLPLQLFQVSPAHALPGSADAHLRPDAALDLGGRSDRGQMSGGPVRNTPPRQLENTTLELAIISSPWATVDSNLQALGDAGLPGVFVVQAVVTNTGTITAEGVNVILDYQDDPVGGWVLVDGADLSRGIDQLAPDEAYYAYWFARYPNDARPENIPVPSHQYTVSAQADNAGPVSTSDNAYGNPPSGDTVEIRSTISTGSSGLIQSSADIVVGVAFTVTVVYDLGTDPDDIIFSPVGNADFAGDAYRLLSSEVRFYDTGDTQESVVVDRLYFPTVPGLPDGSPPEQAEATFNFIAVLPSETALCPYAAIRFGSNPKYDENFCSNVLNGTVPITGTLTLSQTNQASSPTIEQGQALTYTISYANTGDKPLQFARFWDDVPAGVSIITPSISPSQDPDETTETRVAWSLGTIPAAGQPGSTGILIFGALVDGGGQDLEDGTLLVLQRDFTLAA